MCTYHVGVAFRRGCPTNWYDRLVMETTRGPFVHAELVLQDGDRVRTYGAMSLPHRPNTSAIIPTNYRSTHTPPAWETVRFPVRRSAYNAAYAMILQLMSMPIQYNRADLWQCVVPVLLPFEVDVDPRQLPTWASAGGVFCSQFCLLALRRLAMQGHLRGQPALTARLFRGNSRGCSPNALHTMLSECPEKKGTNHGEPPTLNRVHSIR
jgi:hypothetical protein